MIKKAFALLFCFSLILANEKIFAGEDWKEKKEQHFIIYYKSAPEDFVETVGEVAEDYYRQITENLGFVRYNHWNWDNRAEIYIYDDRDDFVRNGKQARWSHGVASIKNKKITTFPAAHGFFDTTLPHELGHIIFREMIGFDIRLPLWFEEGVAMNQERAKRWGAKTEVREAMANGTFMDLDELAHFCPRKKTDLPLIQLFYAESATLIRFLISQYGEDKFIRFCRTIKDKKSFQRAFESQYWSIKTMDRLNEKWIEYLKK